ncbi:MAG: hypothetical protein ABIH23_00350 [bacterium]
MGPFFLWCITYLSGLTCYLCDRFMLFFLCESAIPGGTKKGRWCEPPPPAIYVSVHPIQRATRAARPPDDRALEGAAGALRVMDGADDRLLLTDGADRLMDRAAGLDMLLREGETP